VLNNAVDERGEAFSVAKPSSTNAVENSGQLGIELVVRVDMSVSQILNVFRKVTEKEDVLLANFTRNLNLARA
jgi:acetolactate synthase regulatory subunit